MLKNPILLTPALILLVGTGCGGAYTYKNTPTSSLSSNGRWLAFTSESSNLAPGGDSGDQYNVYVVRAR